jgi:Ca2+-transporting ATPase
VAADPVLATVLAAASLGRGGRRFTGNPWLTGAVTADAALVLAALYLPALRELLGTRPLTLVDLGAVGLASLAGAVTVAVQRWTADRV